MSWRGPLSNSIKELRIHLSQSAPGSAGLRSFIAKSYPAMKQANPSLPILIREAQNVEARAFARYDFGVERKISLENVAENEIAAKILELNNGPVRK
ncbi:hypothetical protein AMAG_02177 [Allomyces macrogynus ATCC 38327]|uniref:Ribosomal protein/NADH dehydrogenase domain-containing protein n=1 Tax=Allomyces macrogynus (strain ATCC 38327) TaxID=578462 RepID=A0A0L0S194_ALLM3|nr:hypothetical protein AMAG_02177 [Allomyces macrogynus ATCC 38327]|eukprot:KNE56357.1 hypothetical protein AMAG_02177 [Allomyces macrogynus ATCC 38327]